MPSYLSLFPFTYIISPPLHLVSTLFPHFEIICSPNLLPQSEIPVCSHIRASLSLFLFLSPLLQRLSDESGGISVESHLKLSLLSISPNSLPARSVPIHPHPASCCAEHFISYWMVPANLLSTHLILFTDFFSPLIFRVFGHFLDTSVDQVRTVLSIFVT